MLIYTLMPSQLFVAIKVYDNNPEHLNNSNLKTYIYAYKIPQGFVSWFLRERKKHYIYL